MHSARPQVHAKDKQVSIMLCHRGSTCIASGGVGGIAVSAEQSNWSPIEQPSKWLRRLGHVYGLKDHAVDQAVAE